MVTIKSEMCSGCGQCVEICHESCMKLSGKTITIDYNACSECGQCAAICSSRALWWDENAPEKITADCSVDAAQMKKFLMSRRTDRNFLPEKPPVDIMRDIINIGAYAPSHTHTFRAVMAYDDAVIDAVDNGLFKITKDIYNNYFKNPIIRFLLTSLLPGALKKEYFKGEPKLAHSIKIGKSYESRPPVIVYLISGGSAPLKVESAQYILYNMDLYARTLGLGCRNLTGNNMFINKSAAVRKALGIKKGEKIYAAAAFGYRAKKFKNMVTGRSLPANQL